MIDKLYFGKCGFKYKSQKNKDISKIIWNIFGGKFFTVIFDNQPMGIENYKDRINNYYKFVYPKLVCSTDFLPFYNLLKHVKNIVSNEEYDIVEILDEKSLEFILTFTGGDEEFYFFSCDYNLDFLSSLWVNYYTFITKNTKIYERELSFCSFLTDYNRDYVKDKKLALIDSYRDDEDSNHFFYITSRFSLYKSLTGSL